MKSTPVLATLLVLLPACGASSDFASGGPSAGGGGSFEPEGAADVAVGDVTEPAAEPEAFVPEEEIVPVREAPQASDRYVFVASRGLDAVVRVDAESLEVDLVEVGGAPTMLRALPGEDAVLVWNQGTRDLSLVRIDAAGEAGVLTLDAPSHVNRLEVAPSGDFAVAWYDPDAAAKGDPLGDLQAVLVVRLAEGSEAVFPVGVGFHPSAVTFVGASAFVVAESGVSEIEMAALSGPAFAPAIPISADPLADEVDREVLVTADGAFAVVRRGGVAELRVIDLESGAATVLPLPVSPTDIDLTPDGAEAVVVLREAAQLLRVPLLALDETTTIDLAATPAGLATLTPDGARAVLFSTLPDQEWVGVLDLGSGALAVHAVEKRIEAAIVTPDGDAAILLHTPEPSEGAAATAEGDLDAFVDAAEGYTVLDLASGFTRLQLLESAPGEVLVTPDSSEAYVLVPGKSAAGPHAVHAVDFASTLAVEHPLGSPPVHAVFVPKAHRVAVHQDHPVGRITFIDVEDGTRETLTGFELNGLIR